MENLLLLFAGSLVMRLTANRNKGAHSLTETGCSVLTYNNDPFEYRRTRYGDRLYAHDCMEGNVGYGVICVAMQKGCEKEHALTMLASYMEKLKSPFSIHHATGLQPTTDWNTPGTRCLEDYWQDEQGMDWKVKGYTNGRLLAVLYVSNITEAGTRRQEEFLDSFYFGLRKADSQ